MAAVTGALMLAKTMTVLWLIGRNLDSADRKEGGERAVLRRRAFWLGVQEAVWFFCVGILFSAI